ncbi:hypothetical protein CTA2_2547, partial [Colletotrichum tanaceti]
THLAATAATAAAAAAAAVAYLIDGAQCHHHHHLHHTLPGPQSAQLSPVHHHHRGAPIPGSRAPVYVVCMSLCVSSERFYPDALLLRALALYFSPSFLQVVLPKRVTVHQEGQQRR